MKKPYPAEVITSSIIFLWIFIVNIFGGLFSPVPTWPMYFVTIFYFTMGADNKKIKNIFISALTGVCFAWVFFKGLAAFSPVIGTPAALIILLFVVLGLIIVGGCYFPICFNNVTFAYLTIATINMEIVSNMFLPWILMLLAGGGIILAGAIYAGKLSGNLCTLFLKGKVEKL